MTDAIVKSPRGRTKRISQIQRGPLSVRGKESGYQYRIVNDIEGRVEQFQEVGYELVADKDVSIGDKRVDKASPIGSVKQFHVGGGVKGVLMRQSDANYAEDQAAKEAVIANQENAYKKTALNDYGSVKISRE